MGIRGWHLAVALFFLKTAGSAEGAGGSVFFLMGLSIIYGAALGTIPALLLYFSKTRMVGAITAVLFGLIGVFSSFTKVVGLFLIAAGILSLWKDDR